MPIYYVVFEITVVNYNLPVYRILKVIECDLADYQELYDKEVAPLVGTGRQVQAMFFYREPANPFQEKAKEGKSSSVRVGYVDMSGKWIDEKE